MEKELNKEKEETEYSNKGLMSTRRRPPRIGVRSSLMVGVWHVEQFSYFVCLYILLLL
jgi:hypothetical protein